jgi:hypothetical protein
MDAINNLAGAASKAIFGNGVTGSEGGEEPVAGVQGAGTANEPFDKGNETVSDNSTSRTSFSFNQADSLTFTDSKSE